MYTEAKQNVSLEGYLQTKSGKQFIVLQSNYLYCYKDNNKTKTISTINLKSYNKAKVSQQEVGSFELISNSYFIRSIVFNAESAEDMEDWVNNINQVMEEFKVHEKTKEQKLLVEERSLFSFGERRDYYWDDQSLFHEYGAKYGTIKEEVISNKICTIPVEEFESAYNKALQLIQDSPFIKKLISKAKECEAYKIDPGTPISIQNILTIILYSDYDTLSNRFSSTFRKVLEDEDSDYTRKRNQEFWNWSKTLIETVNVYGTGIKDSKIPAFYHGVSFMYFNSFAASFNSPTSATTKLQIAHIFATDDGIIMELGQARYGVKDNVKYFNCSMVSCYGNEDERLFIQPYRRWQTLHILSIRNMSTNENYKDYIEALTVFQHLTQGMYAFESCNVSKKTVGIINDLISICTDDVKIDCPEYVLGLMDKLFENNVGDDKSIKISAKTLKAFPERVNLHDPLNPNIIHIDQLNKLFKSVENITLVQIDFNSNPFWHSLTNNLETINKMSFSTLKQIKIGIDSGSNDELNGEKEYKSLCMRKGWKLSKDEKYYTITKSNKMGF